MTIKICNELQPIENEMFFIVYRYNNEIEVIILKYKYILL